MNTTIDSAGRLVIPGEIRREAGIKPGTKLDIRWRDGLIEIEPAATPITLERKGKLLVAVPEVQLPTLRAATVESTRRAIRRERRGPA